MISKVFTDFYKQIPPVDKTNYQSTAAAKKKTKYTLPLTLAGTAAGVVYPIFKVNKNINMQYAVFVKEKLKPLMTDEFDKEHRHSCIPKFSKNPITHIKEIKDSIKNYDEDILSYQESLSKSKNKPELEKAILNIKSKKNRLQQFLVEYEMLFIDINSEFKNHLFQKMGKKVLSSVLILSTIATAAGMVTDKLIEKRGKN